MRKGVPIHTRKCRDFSHAEQTFAAKAHIAIYPNAKQSAALNDHHISTEHRHRLSGPPALTLYAQNARDKWRLAAHMTVLARGETVEKLTQPQLFERFRELQREFRAALCQCDDMGASEVDRASADEKLSALAAERAAIRVRFEREGIVEADVWRSR